MLNLPASDKTNGFQKVIALLLMGGAVLGAVMLFNAYVAPHMIDFFTNVWKMVFIGGPLVLAALYVINNPLFIWGFFKTLSWKITKFWIKMDPLSVMDRYVDYLRKKLVNLNKSIQVVRGKEEKLIRKIVTLEEEVKKNLRLGKAAIQTGNNAQASLYGTKVAGDKQSIQIFTPLHEKAEKSLNFMTSLSENWKYGIEKLTYEIDRKRTEYEIIKEVTKGLKTVDDYINSDNEAVRIYGESIRVLEEEVTQRIGYIDEFERLSKPLIDGMEIEKKATNDEGLEALEKYMESGDLLLPDFSASTQELQYEEIKTTNMKENKKSKFGLNKVVILLFMVIGMGLNANSQGMGLKLPVWEPYIGVGTSVSSGVLTYSGEVGIYSEKVWVAIGTSVYEDPANDKQWFGSFKLYRRVLHTGIIDNYLYLGTNVHIAKDRAISLDPGIVTVFNIGPISPQVSVTFPIYENQPVYKTLPITVGVGLNWFIK